MKKILITTAIDYTNDVIHIGHAYQKIVADTVTRYYRLIDCEVFFVTGNDQYGTTNYKAAQKAGKDPLSFVKDISAKDRKQFRALHIQYDRYIETTDKDHHETVAEFYLKSFKNGDIYKAPYQGLYCEGCEANKTLSELVDGKCPMHLTREIQKVEEENYFFRWKKYSEILRDLLKKDKVKVIPSGRKKEMLGFIKNGIQDIPISRPIEKVPWGIPVPNDPKHVIYVWFDALINYFTAAKKIDYWDDNTEIIHILGKDNARWHVLLWPAMLLSVGLRLPNVVYTHGFINLNGQKISKSLGNVIRPTDLVKEFGTDAVRYYFLRYGPESEDVDVSIDKLRDCYNTELANDWGNLVQRVVTLAEKGGYENTEIRKIKYDREIGSTIEQFAIREAIEKIHDHVRKVNENINQEEPWKKNGKELNEFLTKTIQEIRWIAYHLLPFMPESSKKILDQFSMEKIIVKVPYFPRKK